MDVNNIKNERVNDNFKTLYVEGSNSPIYGEVLKSLDRFSEAQVAFAKLLKNAMNAKVADFEVPLWYPSVDETGHLNFIPGAEPAIGYTWEENEKLASESGMRIGTIHERVLYIAKIMHSLVKDGWNSTVAEHVIFSPYVYSIPGYVYYPKIKETKGRCDNQALFKPYGVMFGKEDKTIHITLCDTKISCFEYYLTLEYQSISYWSKSTGEHSDEEHIAGWFVK